MTAREPLAPETLAMCERVGGLMGYWGGWIVYWLVGSGLLARWAEPDSFRAEPFETTLLAGVILLLLGLGLGVSATLARIGWKISSGIVRWAWR